MKPTGTKKKSSSSSRSKNYYGVNAPSGSTKLKKEVLSMQSNAMTNYKGGQFLRGRKYSFPINQKEKRKLSDNTKLSNNSQLKKLSNKNSMNLMMLNVGGDPLSQGYEDLLGYNIGSNKIGILKPGTSNSRQNVIKYSTGSKKKKSNSAQSSPHRNGIKSTKNQNYSNGNGINIGPAGINENRPYSAKNSGYNRPKPHTSKSKNSEMKRSSSKKSPTAIHKDFTPVFTNKYNRPSGIGLYQPGKIKLTKEKPSVSSRGSSRWNNQTSNLVKVSKFEMLFKFDFRTI